MYTKNYSIIQRIINIFRFLFRFEESADCEMETLEANEPEAGDNIYNRRLRRTRNISFVNHDSRNRKKAKVGTQIDIDGMGLSSIVETC